MAQKRRTNATGARRKAKKQPTAKSSSAQAVKRGNAQAQQVLDFRAQQLRRRTAAINAIGTRRRISAVQDQIVPPKVLAALGPAGSAGILIAEGDSWFDYPFHDVLEVLEDEHGFDVESVAHRGDNVEDMAYASGQLEEFSRRLEKILRGGKVPKAILLSGGGNDIAGTELGMLLNHAGAPNAGLNDSVVRGVIDERIRGSFISIITAITAICKQYLQRPVPILVHGYDYTVPDGRGFLGGWSFLPGPWLEPSFRKKGFLDRGKNTDVMRDLMDRFNEMLKSALTGPAYAHVTYIDLRRTLSNGADYKTYWANELHPTVKGFRMVAQKFADLIDTL